MWSLRSQNDNFKLSIISVTTITFLIILNLTGNEGCYCFEYIDWDRSVCARVSLKQYNNCSACDDYDVFFELQTTNPEFPEVLGRFGENIGTIVARPGCTIEIYEKEGFRNYLGIVKEDIYFNKSSDNTYEPYKCKCNDTFNVNARLEELLEQEKSQLEVPDSLDEIVSQFRQQNYAHPGLLSAFSSLTHGRSSKNSYILLVGSSGAGKSSTINILLNNQNVTLAGETTSEILEFHVPIPVPELGVTNSELRIIDTPGLGDSRGLQHDAIFLATLDNYLSEHSELKTKIPNLVLVFHHFTDNRYNGEASKFVNMIRGLDSFRTRITDENYSNVLFVFTHFCSETSKTLLQNPSIKLMRFKEVIEKYTLFPKPILTSVIENKGKENELLMVNDNYVLPNNEHFPSNLIHKFDTITMNGSDAMGRTIISTAFKNRREHLNVSKSSFGLVSPHHPKVAKYSSLLSNSSFHYRKTEISKQLAISFRTMPSNLRKQFPTSLKYLQKYLNLRIIYTKADLPDTTEKILELCEKMEKTDAVLYLLHKGLNLNPPIFSQPILVSYSYSSINDSVLPTSPYKLNTLKISEMGYQLPDAIKCGKKSSMFNKLNTFHGKEEYVLENAFEVGINLRYTDNLSMFSWLDNKIRNGFFVKDTSCSEYICSFVASRFYQLFKLDLNKNASLSQSFIQRVNNLSAFDESNYENVELWTNFFNDYGTHVVTSAGVGGRIDINVRSPSTISVASFNTLNDKLFQTVEFTDNVNSLISNEKIDPEKLLPSGITYSLEFHGGSPSYHTSNLAGLNLEDAIKIMKNWKKSLKYDPIVYPLGYVSIDQVAQVIESEKSDYIREALMRLYNSSLNYYDGPSHYRGKPYPRNFDSWVEFIRNGGFSLEIELDS
ncbi:unnamed protein product [Orchesella dallaii]|uniref:MACPF domain-containing protein n=1 Tax=Orchesella dallaii TaxID=48710 RepID=A0ABP1S9R1_9HEXA